MARLPDFKDEKKPTNPVKAIRAKCLDCCCGQQSEVKLCENERCALHPFRFGKNPYRAKVTRELTEEQRAELAERLRKMREKREAQMDDRKDE